MAYAARYVFQCSYDAQEQITRLFDFVGPTAIALWNLRWQVQGFVQQVPDASTEDLVKRFALRSGMRGGEIRRACIDISWESQLEQFSNIILVTAISIFEDFTSKLVETVSTTEKQRRELANALQFPSRAFVAPGSAFRDTAVAALLKPSAALSGVFTRDARSQRRYAAGPKLDHLLLCYRFFKSLRNAIAHNGGRVSAEVLSAYARYKPKESPTELGLQEVPQHSGVGNLGDKIKLQIRGVTGLTNVILHIITTYDVDFSETLSAERDIALRLRRVSPKNNEMFPADPLRREQRILKKLQTVNLPTAKLTTAFEVFLKEQGIIPKHA